MILFILSQSIKIVFNLSSIDSFFSLTIRTTFASIVSRHSYPVRSESKQMWIKRNYFKGSVDNFLFYFRNGLRYGT